MKKYQKLKNDLVFLEKIISFAPYRNNLTPEQKDELTKGLMEILNLLNEGKVK